MNKSIECAKNNEQFGQASPKYPGDDFLVKGKLTHLNSRILDIFTSIITLFDGQHDLVKALQIEGK